MVDYTRSVGTAGTMFIRDNGSTVEFIIQCTDPATNVGQYRWSGVVNGVGVGGTVSLPAGFGYRSLGTWGVSSSQTVTFHQDSTGTSGLGGAADLSANINRASAPSRPSTPNGSSFSTSGMTIGWSIPANNGAGIDLMILRRRETDGITGSYTDYNNGGSATSRAVTGLAAGTNYWWTVTAHNSAGYSPESPILFAPTLPNAPTTPSMSGVSPTGMTATWTKGSNGNGITGYDIQIDDNSSFSSPSTYSTTSLSRAFTGLTPGNTYYLRVRAKTASGVGAWSGTRTQATSLGTPSGLAFSAVTPTGLTLTWGATTGATGYDIQYSTNSSFSGATTVTSTTASRAITGLTPGVTYYFRVRATTSEVDGNWSSAANTGTPPSSAPGLLVAPAASGASAAITFTPPGGATGVTKYTLERRVGSSGTVTSTDVTGTTYTQTGLVPGTTYQWRASAWFGGYQSPWTGWTSVTQPNPNTSPGDYFDGSTAARDDLTFGWTGTVNNSTSRATGVGVTGWVAGSGAGGELRLQRITGGRSDDYGARMIVVRDLTGAGAYLGMDPSGAAGFRAAVEEGALYVGSIYVKPSRSQRLACAITWVDAAGVQIGANTVGDATVVSTTGWTRLIASGVAPAGAVTATARAVDVTGTGWSVWQSGQSMDADDVMITLSTLFPWFSGDTPDGNGYDYEWLGTPNASPSARFEVPISQTDPLLDPDCPPLPSPPSLPTIPSDCIEEVGTWRRYTLEIPASEVRTWSSTLPTLTLTTHGSAERQVRIRYYPNPDGLPPEEVTQDGWEAELILTYIPPNTDLIMDGVTQMVTASVNGGAPISANRLLYGTGGVPATWPELRCGISYVVTMDVPLDAPAGNLDAQVTVTQRM